jgi:hypothetical protein
MPIHFDDKQAVFEDVAGVEEAEALLEWLQNNPKATVDFAACSHLHAANLQVLMAHKAPVAAWPNDYDLRAWLESTLIKA